jgi:hypothetical protein
MEKTTSHITEYRDNQDIDFNGITSFKVQNHGESTVDINTIPVYPGQTITFVEQDGTFCDFKLKSVFTEEGKLPKFKAIYKQLASEAGSADNLHPVQNYTVTLYNYDKADIVDFSQNISGHTVLTRSFDDGLTFDPSNDIDLGYVPANQVIKYDRGGSLGTTAIQFRNEDLTVNSEIFMVTDIVIDPWVIIAQYQDICAEGYFAFTSNKSGDFETNLFDIPLWERVNTVSVESGVESVRGYGYPPETTNGAASVFYSIKRLETGEIKYFSFAEISGGNVLVPVEIPNPYNP